jgi:hypothetical protein
MSPEQARGPDVDGRTDIYALGCIGYELLVGRHPFEHARTVTALIAAHVNEVPPTPRSIDPSISPELDLLLFAMVAKDPQHRPTLPQIRSVVDAVRMPARESHVRAVDATAPPPINRRAVAVVGLVLILGIVIGTSLRGAGSEGDRRSERPTILDAGAPALIAATPLDARLADVARPTPYDAGPTHHRVAGASRPRTSIVVDAPVDAGPPTVSEASIGDAGVVSDAESSVDAAPARPLQPPTLGYLRILSPPGAQVLVDGLPPDGALTRLPLVAGRHKVQFIRGSDKNWFTVTIEAGATHTLDERDLYSASSGSDDRNRTVNPFARKQAPR